MTPTREGYEHIIDLDGCELWHLNGERHREDGPACKWDSGSIEWYLNGKRHREGGPAFYAPNGHKEWAHHGLRHREDGPAVEYYNGDKEWFLNGMLHREDGPAYESPETHERHSEWFLNGTQLSEKDFNEVWNCPLDRLPLYINTVFAPIVKRRLNNGA